MRRHVRLWVLASAFGTLLGALPALAQQSAGGAVANGNSVGATQGATDATATVGLEEVVVTAQRREESLQHAAVAVSAVSADELAQAQVSTPGGLSSVVPSLQIADTTGPTPLLYLRGVGNFSANVFSDSAIAFNFDNVYIGRPTSTSGFFYDIDRVEVLKGPQGTLYGRNATGGAINVISKQPELDSWGADVSAQYGNYATVRADGALNAPLGNDAAIRLAVFHVEHNGYMNDGTDDQDETGGRLTFRWDPLETLKINLVADYAGNDQKGNGATFVAGPGPFPGPSFSPSDRIGVSSPQSAAFLAGSPDTLNGRTFAPFPNNAYDHSHGGGVSATINWTLPFGTVTVIPAYRNNDTNYLSYLPGFQLRDIESGQQKSFEARLSSNDALPLRYVLGAFWYDEINHVPGFDVNQQADTSFQTMSTDTVSRAAFARLTYAIVDPLRVSAGIRYTKEDKDFQGVLVGNDRICALGFLACPTAAILPYNVYTPVPASPFGPFGPVLSPAGTFDTLSEINNTGANMRSASYNKITWHAGVDYDLTQQNLLFASVETGFKAGGFFFSSDNGVYKPETITAYTLGSKNRFLDNRLQLNLELYYWDYKNQQISHLGEDSLGVIIFPTQNVGAATVKGAEVEAQAKPFEYTLVETDIQYNSAVYQSFVYNTPNLNSGAGNGTGCPNGAAPTSTYTVNCSGQQAPFAPRWTLSGDIQQRLPLPNGASVIAEADARYQSATLTALDFLPEEIQGGYAIADFSVTYEAMKKRYFIAGFVNNAFNRTVVDYSDPVPFSFILTQALRPPRLYGVRAGVHF
jgi:iron complex outermembrane receptor protein